jgi:hypothetical protein
MSDVLEEAVRRSHLRFLGSSWDILSPQEQDDAISEKIHRINESSGKRQSAVRQLAGDNLKRPAGR